MVDDKYGLTESLRQAGVYIIVNMAEEGVLELAADEQQPTVDLLKCYPRSCRGEPWYGGNKEALAWAVDTAGIAIAYVGAAAFLGTTLLRLAKEDAGCVTEIPEGETTIPKCEGRVYGIRPSSLLTSYTIIVGVTTATFMPLMGSLVDYTPHRRLLGRTLSVAFLLFYLPQIFVSQGTWFMVAIFQLVVTFIGWGHTMLVYAYLPELTSDEKLQNKYTANFGMVNFGSMVAFIGFILGISYLSGNTEDDIFTARLSIAIAFALTSFAFGYAWITFDARPAARELPKGASIWTEGFKQIWHTSKIIHRDYRGLGWFYVAVAIGDGVIQSLKVIAVTYLTDVLLLTSFESGLTILLLLLGCVPGGFLCGWFIDRYNTAIWSSMICTSILAANTFLAATILTGPGQQLRAYGVGFIWGVGVGWKWSSDRLMSSTLIPPGQDAELMGLYLFAGQCLTWLPPLVYTGLNEAGVNQRINIASLNVFFILSLIAYFCMGKYEDVLEVANLARAAIEDTNAEEPSQEDNEEKSNREAAKASIVEEGARE